MFLRVENLNLEVDHRVLISQFSGEWAESDRVVVTGSSGSGKSSFLRSLALLVPARGGLWFENDRLGWEEWGSLEQLRQYRRSVVYVHQRPEFDPSSTALENLLLPLSFKLNQKKLFSSREAAKKQAVDWLMKLSGHSEKSVSQLLGTLVTSLSGGEQQILAMVRTLLVKPRFLLLDEPTASLDLESERRFAEGLSEIHSGGWMWVSHSNDTMDLIGDQRLEFPLGP